MKKIILLISLVYFAVSCADSDDMGQNVNDAPQLDNFDWTIPSGLINGSDNPFPLAKDPKLFKVSEVQFLSDESLAAVAYIEGEIRVYPYLYLNSFESVNDQVNGISYALTYCPQTQSALLINNRFKTDNFVLRASGYLLHDNVILKDESSETYWSQMLGQCIKGRYAGEFSGTFNFVEMTWKTVRTNFPDAKVFTISSISQSSNNTQANKADVKVGDLVYGIIGRTTSQQFASAEAVKNTEVFIYHYDDFGDQTELLTDNIANKQTLIIGNRNDHYITSYINDGTAVFQAVQNKFPIVMKDSEDNYWNVFGVAVEGPRTGQQLASPVGFFALFWAWDEFYDDFNFVD